VLDANGVKMSKRLGNIVDPWSVIPNTGRRRAAVPRVVQPGLEARAFDEAQIREGVTVSRHAEERLRRHVRPVCELWMGTVALDPRAGARPAIDRWMLSRLATVEREVDALLEASTQRARRRRSWASSSTTSRTGTCVGRATGSTTSASDDNRAAFATLHEVLVVTVRLLAPLAPF
jgi:isoleucyl-tRNA synthetase